MLSAFTQRYSAVFLAGAGTCSAPDAEGEPGAAGQGDGQGAGARGQEEEQVMGRYPPRVLLKP